MIVIIIIMLKMLKKYDNNNTEGKHDGCEDYDMVLVIVIMLMG